MARLRELNFMDQQFLAEYVQNGNKLTEAARDLGMDPAYCRGLSKCCAFQEEFERLTGTILGQAEVNYDRIVRELSTVAFFDPKDILNDDGTMKPMNEIPPNVRRAIGGLEVTVVDGETYLKITTKPKIYDKMKALELLGKTANIKMFVDKVETEGKDDVARKANMEIEERMALMEKDRASVVKEK